MKSVVETQGRLADENQRARQKTGTAHGLVGWWKRFAGCRLCRNLTAASFVAILLIEMVILIPSYRNYEEDLLRRQVNVAAQALTTLLTQVEPESLSATSLQRLMAQSSLEGVVIDGHGKQLVAGAAISNPGPAGGGLRNLARTDSGHLAVAWPSGTLVQGYRVQGLVNVSQIPGELVAFVFRILGLSLLIAVFVTLVTMAVVDRMMLSPLLRLRGRISLAGDDAEHPLQYVRGPERCDEFGEVESAFNGLLRRNASYLSRLQELNSELDQLLDERTQSLRQTEQELEIRTLYDQLTGLANRNLFEEQLDRFFQLPIAQHPPAEALLVMGLNDFQTLNGLAGHDTGDRVLQEVARRLAGFSTDHGHVARLGGDVFGLLVQGTDHEPLETRISKIIEACEAPVVIDGHPHECEFSAGVAVAPLDGQDAKTLLSHAEIAMHRAKKSSGTQVQFFASELGEQVQRRQNLVRDLKLAVERKQFELYYQPQLDDARRIIGYEALLRWQHPDQGFVSPGEFIPLAEETGLIGALGDWVLEQSVAQLSRWAAEGFEGRVAVNVSAVQLNDPNLSQRIAELLHRYRVEAGQLELEITETALMENVDCALSTLRQFRAQGLLVAIDDFGTGYSSLAYLKMLPVSRIKIDRAFVTGLPDNHQDAALCRSIINMAHNLECEVIAEGVEIEAQATWLIGAGCDELQGFLFGKPAPRDEVVETV
jgi:diguanylate cyclase (GGDEF)-like protein